MALILAVTFALYGTFKKKVNLHPFSSLFIEALYVLPLCLGYIIYLFATGQNVFFVDTVDTIFMALSGVATAIPYRSFFLRCSADHFCHSGVHTIFMADHGLFAGFNCFW